MFVLFLLLIVNASSLLEASNDHILADSVLCRSCGSDFLSTDAIISKLSPVSLYSFNDTIFNSDSILVQVLPKDFVLQFPIITVETSACLGVGEWEEDDYWFPGYRWKPCGCSKCGAFVGWIFEPNDPFSVVVPEQFFGLIPAHLVSKSCNYSFFLDQLVGVVLSCMSLDVHCSYDFIYIIIVIYFMCNFSKSFHLFSQVFLLVFMLYLFRVPCYLISFSVHYSE